MGENKIQEFDNINIIAGLSILSNSLYIEQNHFFIFEELELLSPLDVKCLNGKGEDK